MKRFGGSVFIIALAMLAGAAVGYCLSPGATDAARPSAGMPSGERRASRIRDAGDSASIRALRSRIAELERMLAEKSSVEEPTNAVAAEVKSPAPRPSPGQWLENLKKTDPKRYVQVTNHFERMRRHRYERMCRNLDFLASVDVSGMSESARETHVALQEAMLQQDELSERLRELHESGEATEADRQAIFNEMRDNGRQLHRLRREERDNLFKETAKNLGFKGKDADEIVRTIKDIIESTEGDSGRHHRHGRR